MTTLTLNSIQYPGVMVSEDVAGLIPTELASHTTVYMLGTSASGSTLNLVPTQVTSVTDFTNQFGTSPSLNAVTLFFNNAPNGVLYFVRCGNTATAANFVTACQNAFDPEYKQGFLIAPEAFQTLTSQSDRTSVAVAMENLCATEGYDWMAFVDSGPPATIDTVAEFSTEGQLYTTPRGHLAYFCPYVVDLNDNNVPPSAAIAGIAVRRFNEKGFNQPPAGAKYAIRGVKNVATKITNSQQATLNPNGINCIRNLPNLGVVAWGSRTRSSSGYYRFVSTRVILNTLIGTLRHAFDSEIFSSIDGKGVLFSRIKETAVDICYRLYTGGALYGATTEDAYAVLCGPENNPSSDLESGIARLDVYAAPSPVMERLLIRVVRTALGEVKTSAGLA